MKACNLVMDEATGRRPDGDTCQGLERLLQEGRLPRSPRRGRSRRNALPGIAVRTDYGKPYPLPWTPRT